MAARRAVKVFVRGGRVTYAAPTRRQVKKFWREVCRALKVPIKNGVFCKNESPDKVIFLPDTDQAITALTAWDADTLRGDWADFLILDEFQLMHESAWNEVGAPMLTDTDGVAWFIYTPPSLRTVAAKSRSKDPRHASKLYKKAESKADGGRWAAFTFTSHDNPTLSSVALAEISEDMTEVAYRQEILAEDVDENPNALFHRQWIEDARMVQPDRDLVRIVAAVDPPGGSETECGITAVGISAGSVPHYFVLADNSLAGSSDEWGRVVATTYHAWGANFAVAEGNYGGDMVRGTIHTIDPDIPVQIVHASLGKAARAEPAAALTQQGRVHFVGSFPRLEDELCQWQPGYPSPNRLDSFVWAVEALRGKTRGKITVGNSPLDRREED